MPERASSLAAYSFRYLARGTRTYLLLIEYPNIAILCVLISSLHLGARLGRTKLGDGAI